MTIGRLIMGGVIETVALIVILRFIIKDLIDVWKGR